MFSLRVVFTIFMFFRVASEDFLVFFVQLREEEMTGAARKCVLQYGQILRAFLYFGFYFSTQTVAYNFSQAFRNQVKCCKFYLRFGFRKKETPSTLFAQRMNSKKKQVKYSRVIIQCVTLNEQGKNECDMVCQETKDAYICLCPVISRKQNSQAIRSKRNEHAIVLIFFVHMWYIYCLRCRA